MKSLDRPLAGSLQGKVAVVTGASRGAGRGIALALAEAGATVYVTGRSVRGERLPKICLARLTKLPKPSRHAAAQGLPCVVIIRLTPMSNCLFVRVQREQGRLDLLVNNSVGRL